MSILHDKVKNPRTYPRPPTLHALFASRSAPAKLTHQIGAKLKMTQCRKFTRSNDRHHHSYFRRQNTGIKALLLSESSLQSRR
jgi:hypothetical protein